MSAPAGFLISSLDLNSSSKTHEKAGDGGCVQMSTALGSRGKTPWGLLARQPSLIGQFQGK